MSGRQPTFGEFLTAAYRDMSAAAAQHRTVTPGRDAEELAGAVAHVSTVLSRYTGDLTRNIDQLPDQQLARIGLWDRAALRTHDALTSASRALAARPGKDQGTQDTDSPGARSLHAAAASLAAGRDLLQGHFSTDPSGARLHQSSWALAMTSPAVSRALLAEVASLARQVAAVCPAEAPLTSSTGLADVRARLNAARYWFSQPEPFVRAADASEPLAPGGRDVLHAVPVNVIPDRSVPESPECVAELCDAVITTSERARKAAWAAARVDPLSPAMSVTSWHRIAAASTVTSHHCHLLFTALADRAAQDEASDLSAALALAAIEASHAREIWLDCAREFEEITTEVRGHMSPAAIEAAELALWSGRLAYADPDWNLSSGPSRPVRSGASLAPRSQDLAGVVGAVHQAADALSNLAAANLEQARLAVRARRVLVSTRSLPERCNVAYRFAEAPQSYTISLVACCQDTARAAAAAAEQGAEIAARVGAPSRVITAAKAVAREHEAARPSSATSGARADALEVGKVAGPVETRLRGIGVTSTRMLWRASAVDRAGEQVIGDAQAELAQRRAQADSIGPGLRGRAFTGRSSRSNQLGAARTSVPVRRELEAEP